MMGRDQAGMGHHSKGLRAPGISLLESCVISDSYCPLIRSRYQIDINALSLHDCLLANQLSVDFHDVCRHFQALVRFTLLWHT